MTVYNTGYDLLSPEYVANTEQILQGLVRGAHRIAKATLHGQTVYIIVDFSLAKQIFEDSKNFAIAATELSHVDTLTDGTQAYVEEGLDSPLTSAAYDDYKETRKNFNQAMKHAYTDRSDVVDQRARQHIDALLDRISGSTLDALTLCRQYWLPLMAEVIGIASLPLAELSLLMQCARTLVQGNGLLGDRAAIAQLTQAHQMVIALITRVITSGTVPAESALGYLLKRLDTPVAIDITRAFILGGIDTGSGALALQTHLLASHAEQQRQFLQLSASEQQNAMLELVAKEAPAYYSPRFALQDINILGIDIPAGSFIQLASYALNHCANPDFDIRRADKSACPMHRQETLPFGHARHKCPGEILSRRLGAIFLNGLFGRYRSITIKSYRREPDSFSRSISELILNIDLNN
ncbi:MAG TPA: cytochrome P450 [Spongiibacteraceae bacterium]|nr:cytochrome P450 [Spongiibacteraceae bacterium]